MCRNNAAEHRPIPTPTRIDPKNSRKNSPTATRPSDGDRSLAPLRDAKREKVSKRTIDTASFKTDLDKLSRKRLSRPGTTYSPKTRLNNTGLTFNFLNTDNVATGSTAEIKEPKIRHSNKDKPTPCEETVR